MWRLNITPFLAAVLVGCATSDWHTPSMAGANGTVLFPEVRLRDGEYIEEFRIRIKGGRVSAIQRIPEDWDIAVEWEDGSCVVVLGRAGHFSGGLPNIDRLNGTIFVQADPDARIQAVVTADRTDRAGGGGRMIPFRHLALRSQFSSGSRTTAHPTSSFRVAGTVKDARNGQAVAEFRVTPRYAFTRKTDPVYGEWDEYEGERFYGGKFDLTYDHPLLIGAIEAPGWQLLIEAEGYEPFVTRVVASEENSPELECRLIPAAAK